MYKIIDNFLDNNDFELFSKATFKASSTSWGAVKRNINFGYWTKTLEKEPNADFEKNVSSIFGPIVYKTIDLICKKMKEEIADLPPTIGMAYLFQNYPYSVPKHIDRLFRDPMYYNPEFLKDCYSSFLYAHTEWDKSWGGQLCFHSTDQKIEPIPNRLVYYSSDEFHSVSQISINKEKNIRKVFQLYFIPTQKLPLTFAYNVRR